MKIEIMGMGCQKCIRLFETVQKAVKELGSNAEVIKIEDAEEIVKRGIIVTPAILINGDVKSSGNIPSLNEIKKWISEELESNK